MAEVVSGVGPGAKRTDQNISSRVSKIQRDAKIQNATGGTYGQAGELTTLAQGASTNVNTPQVDMSTALPMQSNLPPVADAFAPGDANTPITDGAPGDTPGRAPHELPPAVTAPDQLSVLARAMFMQNPTPQLRRIVEAFNEEGR